jgi:hypothetical protein
MRGAYTPHSNSPRPSLGGLMQSVEPPPKGLDELPQQPAAACQSEDQQARHQPRFPTAAAVEPPHSTAPTEGPRKAVWRSAAAASHTFSGALLLAACPTWPTAAEATASQAKQTATSSCCLPHLAHRRVATVSQAKQTATSS